MFKLCDNCVTINIVRTVLIALQLSGSLLSWVLGRVYYSYHPKKIMCGGLLKEKNVPKVMFASAQSGLALENIVVINGNWKTWAKHAMNSDSWWKVGNIQLQSYTPFLSNLILRSPDLLCVPSCNCHPTWKYDRPPALGAFDSALLSAS